MLVNQLAKIFIKLGQKMFPHPVLSWAQQGAAPLAALQQNKSRPVGGWVQRWAKPELWDPGVLTFCI